MKTNIDQVLKNLEKVSADYTFEITKATSKIYNPFIKSGYTESVDNIADDSKAWRGRLGRSEDRVNRLSFNKMTLERLEKGVNLKPIDLALMKNINNKKLGRGTTLGAVAVHKRMSHSRFFGYAWDKNQYRTANTRVKGGYGVKTRFENMPQVFSIRKHKDGRWTKRGELAKGSVGLYEHLPWVPGRKRENQRTLRYIPAIEQPRIEGEWFMDEINQTIENMLEINRDDIRRLLSAELKRRTRYLKKGGRR